MIYREIKDRKGEARTLILQASAYLEMGDRANATASLEQGLAIAKEVNAQDCSAIYQILSQQAFLYLMGKIRICIR
ncbi:hypothetical protein [Nostoc sp. FACHB-280]|uniref:hypothetical protein n=1 Tax=Nostoc sp. FACHB-280 TaxID=2692839 RepID=UPI00168BEAC9|nr:hypothetical protein [Nostoc sp. FACHB-280]MBD2495826.1 hypothetical protein [Nostoc sp. FACHB-280]